MAAAVASYGLRTLGLRQKLRAEQEKLGAGEGDNRPLVEATIQAGFQVGELTKEERNKFRGMTKEYLEAR